MNLKDKFRKLTKQELDNDFPCVADRAWIATASNFCYVLISSEQTAVCIELPDGDSGPATTFFVLEGEWGVEATTLMLMGIPLDSAEEAARLLVAMGFEACPEDPMMS